jgi:DNA-directed RNA polymerase sigma subunit (sigma70/sigma32)
VTASLQESLNDGGADALTLQDVTPDTVAEDPSEPAIVREQSSQLSEMLRRLPQRHLAVLTARYGLDGGRARGHREISAAIGVSEERSRQLEREALQRLRSIAPAFRLAA